MYLAYRDTIDPLFTTMRALTPDIDAITIYTDLNIHPHGTVLRPLSQIDSEAWYPHALGNYKPRPGADPAQETLSYLCQFYDIQNNHTALLKMNVNYAKAFAPLSSLYEEAYGILIADPEGNPVYRFHTADMQEYEQSPQSIIAAAARLPNAGSETANKSLSFAPPVTPSPPPEPSR